MQQFNASGFAENTELHNLNSKFALNTGKLIENVHLHNPWFIPEFVNHAFSSIADSLTEENLIHWLSDYPELETYKSRLLHIGLIMAGNIPLVGLHDFITVLLSENKCVIRLSTKDDKLLPAISAILINIEPAFKNYIFFKETLVKNTDAVIATGSDNSARYFEYYFRKQPHIIRKNRNSTAIITGKESASDLKNLADDIFLYFGLGCRNISKIFVPEKYHIPDLLNNFMHYSWLINHNKYANNYDYNRAIMLINNIPHFDTGFLLVKEDPSYISPVSCLHREFYKTTEDVKKKLDADADILQCIVTGCRDFKKGIKFGTSQNPMLWDYADNIDTLKFLLNLYQK